MKEQIRPMPGTLQATVWTQGFEFAFGFVSKDNLRVGFRWFPFELGAYGLDCQVKVNFQGFQALGCG